MCGCSGILCMWLYEKKHKNKNVSNHFIEDESMNENKKYKLGEFARLLGIHPKTLQRYDKEQKIIAYRTPTNRRYYYYSQYLEFNKR